MSGAAFPNALAEQSPPQKPVFQGKEAVLKPSGSGCGQVRGHAAVGAADSSCPRVVLPILRGRTHTVLCRAELAVRAVGSWLHSAWEAAREKFAVVEANRIVAVVEVVQAVNKGEKAWGGGARGGKLYQMGKDCRY